MRYAPNMKVSVFCTLMAAATAAACMPKPGSNRAATNASYILSASPRSAVADGNSPIAVQAALKGADGEPMVDVAVTLVCSDNNVVLTQPKKTNALGISEAVLTSKSTGHVFLQASFNTGAGDVVFPQLISVAFTPPPKD